MVTSAAMGLTIWDLEADDYDHVQLAANWALVDNHDHTDTKGVRIPTGGIDDAAVTSAKIASGAVTATKIGNLAIARSQMAFSDSGLGDVKYWWRPNPSIDPPDDVWVIADGRVLEEADHDWPIAGRIQVPNLINSFPLGAALSPTGLTPAEAPPIGQHGGSHTINLRHQHNVDGTAVTHTGPDDPLGSVLIRNWAYPFWPWALLWWGLDAALDTDQQLSATTDIRPRHVGLLPLVRVRLA